MRIKIVKLRRLMMKIADKIFTGEDAKRMLEIADGAMVARAAIGDPMVFSRINHYLKTGKEKEFDFKDNLAELMRYISFAKKRDMVSLQRIKHLGAHFLRNVRGASKLRQGLMVQKDLKSIESFLKGVQKSDLVQDLPYPSRS